MNHEADQDGFREGGDVNNDKIDISVLFLYSRSFIIDYVVSLIDPAQNEDGCSKLLYAERRNGVSVFRP